MFVIPRVLLVSCLSFCCCLCRCCCGRSVWSGWCCVLVHVVLLCMLFMRVCVAGIVDGVVVVARGVDVVYGVAVGIVVSCVACGSCVVVVDVVVIVRDVVCVGSIVVVVLLSYVCICR